MLPNVAYLFLFRQKNLHEFLIYGINKCDDSQISFLMDNLDLPLDIPEKIGPYLVQRKIATGGMGDVYLVTDPICHRKLALKQIKKDLMKHKVIQDRFLREARVAAILTHPSIIPIYSIHKEDDALFYTMPYVEGPTLKQILRITRSQDMRHNIVHPIGSSLPALLRIFLNICQAIAYSHQKGILHRDIKPENIIIGNFGEVLLIDWGLAGKIGADPEGLNLPTEIPRLRDLTQVGKILGTVAYMAPERAEGKPSSIQSDIYALGVILYQILTLRLPFARASIETFEKSARQERLVPPKQRSPHREIPNLLSEITEKCLAKDPSKRYLRVEEIIEKVSLYLEGTPEWTPSSTLNISKPSDWKFQENILHASHIAVAQTVKMVDWARFMISKEPFPSNFKLETSLTIDPHCQGIGFILAYPNTKTKHDLGKGITFWIEPAKSSPFKLKKGDGEIVPCRPLQIQKRNSFSLRIEKVDSEFKVWIDHLLIATYNSPIPIAGSHIGFVHRDEKFSCLDWTIEMGSQSTRVSCLTLPDAFLAEKMYDSALIEYRRIARSFPGRIEGQEALFRAGFTLLQKASEVPVKEKQAVLDAAQSEFALLSETAAAPLEYLGKSLVYLAGEDRDEELKCFEIAFRKFKGRPGLQPLINQALLRIYETSAKDRISAYLFVLLLLQHTPEIFDRPDCAGLLSYFRHNLEKLHFLQPVSVFAPREVVYADFAIQLAFWLDRPLTILEMVTSIEPSDDSFDSDHLIENALLGLLRMKKYDMVRENLHKLSDDSREKALLTQLLEVDLSKPYLALAKTADARAMVFLIVSSLDGGFAKETLSHFPRLTACAAGPKEHVDYLLLQARALILCNEWGKAEEIVHQIHTFPKEAITLERFNFLQVCLLAKRGEIGANLSLETPLPTKFPAISSIYSHYLSGSLDLGTWEKQAFRRERAHLYRQLILFYHSIGDNQNKEKFQTLLVRELLD